MLTERTEIDELTAEESRTILDRESQRVLGVGAEEFRRRWLAGDYNGNSDPRVMQVAMLLPDAW